MYKGEISFSSTRDVAGNSPHGGMQKEDWKDTGKRSHDAWGGCWARDTSTRQQLKNQALKSLEISVLLPSPNTRGDVRCPAPTISTLPTLLGSAQAQSSTVCVCSSQATVVMQSPEDRK